MRPKIPQCRPHDTKQRFLVVHRGTSIGFLQPFPEHVAHQVLRFIGHILVGEEDHKVLLVGNTVSSIDNARVAAENMGENTDDAPFTSFGVHDEQLTAQEHFAYIAVEPSADHDFMAEARRRPRPAAPHPDAEQDDELNLGLRADAPGFEDADAAQAEGQYPDDGERRPALTEGVRYKPFRRIRAEHIFSTVHRTEELQRIDKRAKDHFDRVQTFMHAHHREYDTLKEARVVQPPRRLRAQDRLRRDVAKDNLALKRQPIKNNCPKYFEFGKFYVRLLLVETEKLGSHKANSTMTLNPP